MKTGTRISRVFCPVVTAVFVLALTACTPKYAVLVSTNKVTMDDAAIHSEWWYDLVLQYKMLRESGFSDSHIFTLYGDGSDFNTAHPQFNSMTQFGHAITTMPVNRANVQSVFQTVNMKMKKPGYLYVWWMGHGGGAGPGSCDLTMYISNTGETVRDFELKSWVDAVVKYKKRSLSIMTCHSGGLLDDFSGSPNTVVLASSSCVESSYDAPSTCDNVVQAEFNYTQPNALRRRDVCGVPVASDFDADGSVSLFEVQHYNSGAMSRSTPQLGDPSAIATSTVLARNPP